MNFVNRYCEDESSKKKKPCSNGGSGTRVLPTSCPELPSTPKRVEVGVRASCGEFNANDEGLYYVPDKIKIVKGSADKNEKINELAPFLGEYAEISRGELKECVGRIDVANRLNTMQWVNGNARGVHDITYYLNYPPVLYPQDIHDFYETMLPISKAAMKPNLTAGHCVPDVYSKQYICVPNNEDNQNISNISSRCNNEDDEVESPDKTDVVTETDVTNNATTIPLNMGKFVSYGSLIQQTPTSLFFIVSVTTITSLKSVHFVTPKGDLIPLMTDGNINTSFLTDVKVYPKGVISPVHSGVGYRDYSIVELVGVDYKKYPKVSYRFEGDTGHSKISDIVSELAPHFPLITSADDTFHNVYYDLNTSVLSFIKKITISYPHLRITADAGSIRIDPLRQPTYVEVPHEDVTLGDIGSESWVDINSLSLKYRDINKRHNYNTVTVTAPDSRVTKRTSINLTTNFGMTESSAYKMAAEMIYIDKILDKTRTTIRGRGWTTFTHNSISLSGRKLVIDTLQVDPLTLGTVGVFWDSHGALKQDLKKLTPTDYPEITPIVLPPQSISIKTFLAPAHNLAYRNTLVYSDRKQGKIGVSGDDSLFPIVFQANAGNTVTVPYQLIEGVITGVSNVTLNQESTSSYKNSKVTVRFTVPLDKVTTHLVNGETVFDRLNISDNCFVDVESLWGAVGYKVVSPDEIEFFGIELGLNSSIRKVPVIGDTHALAATVVDTVVDTTVSSTKRKPYVNKGDIDVVLTYNNLSYTIPETSQYNFGQVASPDGLIITNKKLFQSVDIIGGVSFLPEKLNLVDSNYNKVAFLGY